MVGLVGGGAWEGQAGNGSELAICQDKSLFRSFSNSILRHGSGLVIFVIGSLATHTGRSIHYICIPTCQLYFTLGSA